MLSKSCTQVLKTATQQRQIVLRALFSNSLPSAT